MRGLLAFCVIPATIVVGKEAFWLGVILVVVYVGFALAGLGLAVLEDYEWRSVAKKARKAATQARLKEIEK